MSIRSSSKFNKMNTRSVITQGQMTQKRRRKIPKEQLKDMKDAFELIDIYDSGFINARELTMAMEFLGFNSTLHEAETIISAIDQDNTGYIDLAEFLEIMEDKYASRGRRKINQELKFQMSLNFMKKYPELANKMNVQNYEGLGKHQDLSDIDEEEFLR